MINLEHLGQLAQQAARFLALASTTDKNKTLSLIARYLLDYQDDILVANAKDIHEAKEHGLNQSMIDRLLLTSERLEVMANDILTIVTLPDPIGTSDDVWKNANDLTIMKQRVPLGVIGIIYESRPNVTTDAASLCFKSGNAIILRGGKEAIHSNIALVDVMQRALLAAGFPKEAIQLVTDTSRETARHFMQLNDYLDVLIPRGGANLIQTVVKTATVPVIETGTGNCHVYVDQDAQLDMAVNIVVNGKCQRPSVCNATETVIVHKAIAHEFLPQLAQKLATYQVALRSNEAGLAFLPNATLATEIDYETEFLDYILAVKVVDSFEEAIQHIQTFSTHHSEVIVTDNYFTAQQFTKQIDAAAVYVNASSRFTDGSVFGFGGEIGISTQKLHARGPMGLKELTSTKYIVLGNGQTR
ncbi:glutamate-5-semialdehyde dehydrogenase [Vagococcus penaei]|uniref:Gamma-glutamyl phosphate reductase n=1 Tax=Vagococcus penaei TaxID=633807 RepID=A0A1Q2D5J3_9ENTE|nr:glutamate-5-semialdehyde dehydrogenase [Vagococcus penaei]AQP53561.1 glutamate-5-semialdehyde dehydrogenase [Vagococcus penaei]RSU07504.1 glutamate-5-semialdehyde dehydrogenase [Vagococcus penaei]